MTVYNKQEARKIVQERLGLMTAEEYAASSETVRSHVLAVLTSFRRNGNPLMVLSYVASAERREVNLSPLERELGGVSFDAVPYDANAPLPVATYDAVLVPLYGFNAGGYRLGHGGGWYDRFLATQPEAYKIGVGLTAGKSQFTEESHDIPMNVIITEGGPQVL